MTDRSDDALSSEELIRRAREGIAPSTETPVERTSPAAGPGSEVMERSTLDPDPGPAPWRTREPEVLEPGVPGSVGPGAAADTSSTIPADLGAAPEAPGPTDGSLLPEHFRPETVTPNRAPGIGAVLSKWRWILAGIFGAVFLFNLATADTAVTDLSVGDCFMEPSGEEIDSVETVECTEPHDFEVFGFVDLANRPGGFPGDTALFNEAGEGCIQPFLDYIGITLDDFDFDVLYDYDVFIPVETSWDAGDREAMCALYATDRDFSPVRSSGSARG